MYRSSIALCVFTSIHIVDMLFTHILYMSRSIAYRTSTPTHTLHILFIRILNACKINCLLYIHAKSHYTYAVHPHIEDTSAIAIVYPPTAHRTPTSTAHRLFTNCTPH